MRWYKEKEFDNTAPEGENGSAEGKVVWVKKFKGSILVAFKTVDQAKAFMEKEDITYMGNKIVRVGSGVDCLCDSGNLSLIGISCLDLGHQDVVQ